MNLIKNPGELVVLLPGLLYHLIVVVGSPEQGVEAKQGVSQGDKVGLHEFIGSPENCW